MYHALQPGFLAEPQQAPEQAFEARRHRLHAFVAWLRTTLRPKTLSPASNARVPAPQPRPKGNRAPEGDWHQHAPACGVAHDINNLLTIILGHVELARLDLDPAADLPLQQIRQAALAIRDLTGQLHEDGATGAPAAEPADAAAIMAGLVQLHRSLVPPAVVLRERHAAPAPRASAGPGHIRRIGMNLIRNAIEAIGDDRGIITVTTEDLYLSEAMIAAMDVAADCRSGRYVAVSVADTGRGIDDATRARMFAPGRSTKGPGRGLGLAVVAAIARAHRGAVGVKSLPGEGATITVFFPIP